MNRKYYLPYVIAQVIAYVLCIALIVTSNEGLMYILGGICATPSIGGLGRLCVFYFRKFRYLFGRKVRDDSGQVIAYTPSNIIGTIVTFFATVYSLYIPVRLTTITLLSGIATMAVTGLISIYYLYSDVNCVIKDCEHYPNKKFRNIIIVICIPLTILVSIICVQGYFTGKYEKKNAKETVVETLPADPMDVSYLTTNPEYLKTICAKALSNSQLEEADDLEDGYEITSSSAIQQIYYLEAEDPAVPFKDYGHNVTLNNAVFIVTNYGIKSTGGFTLDRLEWNIWVYPNFQVVSDSSIIHNETEEFSHYLLAENLNEIKDWIIKEHIGMTIVEVSQ